MKPASVINVDKVFYPRVSKLGTLSLKWNNVSYEVEGLCGNE